MNVTEAINISLSSIKANKLRSFLTLLGLIIGVMTLILVMTIVQGANRYVEEKIADLGTNVFQISKTPLVVTDFQEFIKAQKNKDLALEDAEAIRNQCTDCVSVGVQVQTTSTVKFGNESGEDTSIRGVTANMAEISTINIEDGRYISSFEEKNASPVCVVGRDVVDHLFPHLVTQTTIRFGIEHHTRLCFHQSCLVNFQFDLANSFVKMYKQASVGTLYFIL